jgi:hypothetical protein
MGNFANRQDVGIACTSESSGSLQESVKINGNKMTWKTHVFDEALRERTLA